MSCTGKLRQGVVLEGHVTRLWQSQEEGREEAQEPCVTFLVSLLLVPDTACRDSTLCMGPWKPQCVGGTQNTPLAPFPTAPQLEWPVGRAAPARALRVAQRFPDVLHSLFSGNPAA